MKMNDIEKEADEIIKKVENSNFLINLHFLFLIILSYILVAIYFIQVKKLTIYEFFTIENILSVLLASIPCLFFLAIFSMFVDINIMARIILYFSKDEKYKLAKKIMKNYKKKLKEEEKIEKTKEKEKEKILVDNFKEYLKDLKE
jgi:hypothetical protein